MKLIPLSKTGKKNAGKYFAQVDDEDFNDLNQFDWTVRAGTSTIYASRSYRENGKLVAELMHRRIMNLKARWDLCDHQDGNGLNNQKSNLRESNASQNNSNRKSSGRSIYLGVYYHKKTNKWAAEIQKDGRQKYIGLFLSEIDAAIAYNEFAIKLHGDFAKLNIIK